MDRNAIPGLGFCAPISDDRVMTQTPLQTPPMASEILAPYRARIDTLDDEIVALLGRRYAVVSEVAQIKAERGISSVQPDRVQEVLSRVRALAERHGLDSAFVGSLYSAMIDHAHTLEDRAKQDRTERS